MVTGKVDYNEFFFSRFKSGDELAFEQVFKSNYNQLSGFCQQFVHDQDKAQSLAQETFIHLWFNREKINTLNGIRSFLYTYAKSTCLNYLRHQKVINKYEDNYLQEKEKRLDVEVLESFDFQSLEFSELEKLIEQSINELSERCRMVFRMSRFEGKMNKEIAEELDISVKSVEANITRALKTLKNNLSEFLPAILVHLIFKYLS